MKKKQSKVQKNETVFIRANDAETLKLIKDVKSHTGINVATKAFRYAAKAYIYQLSSIEHLEKELKESQNQLREANELLQRISTANTLLSTYSKKFFAGKYPQPEIF